MKREESRFSESAVFEGMTSVRAVICSIKDGSSDRKIRKILIDRNKIKSKEKDIAYLRTVSSELSFDIEFCDRESIDKISIGNSHGGIVALCTERSIPELSASSIMQDGVYIMIEGIEDPYNFGYAIRSIYASGADGIVLSPRNWMSAAGVVCRSSAGASELIPMFISDPTSSIKIFKGCGYKIAAAGIRDSVSAYDADLKKPLYLIVGGEKRGISRTVIDMCDEIVRLDYGREFRGSLSAASAASIISFEILRQNR